MEKRRRLVIIGSGPAGFTAAIYAARANLAPLLFEGFYSGPAGGQLMTTTDIENFPGFRDGISGPKLMEEMRQQAVRFGAELLIEDVDSVDLSIRPFKVIGRSTTVMTDALIIATGATANRLDIPGTHDNEFWNKGVSACAVCDGAAPIFRNKELYVIGGGDSAMEEGMFLTKYASRVYIVHRRDELRASKIMAQRAMSNPKIEILWSSAISSVEGGHVVESVILKNLKTGEESKRAAGGLFFAIGHTPNTAFLKGQLHLRETGYVRLKEEGTTLTNIEGVFAAGDVFDFRYRQAVTAAGSGCMAALDCEHWLSLQDTHSQ